MKRFAPQLALLIITAVAGCKETPSNYCENVPVTHNCMDDASTGCSSNTQCSAPTPVCDVSGSKACVQCTTADATTCTGTTPVCGATNACEACTAHAQCPSDVCLPDGSCSDGTNVAYVAPNGSGSTCTKAAPCGTLAAALTTTKPFVKMAAGLVKDTATTTIDGKTVTVLAESGTKLDRDGDGPILDIRSANANVTIYDLTVTGASGVSGGDGIQLTPNGGTPKLSLTRVTVTGNQGAGIACTGGSLTVSRSTVSSNQGGGIAIAGSGATFDVTNSFIFRNGNNSSATFGGVDIGVTSPGQSRLEFNTIVDNQATAGPLNSGGVLCSASSFAAPNNIVARNLVGSSTTDTNAQTLGACTYATSAIASTVSGLAFAHADASPFDYHLTSGSTAIDQAMTSSSVVVDFDGDLRPQGAQKDIGADEFR